MKLHTKLAIFVLILFALVVTAMLLWKPVKVKYYTSKLQSDNIKVRQAYAKKLLEMGAREPVFRYYTDKYDPNSVLKRIEVVYELCELGDKGKNVMKEIFRNWCFGPSQQVKIPAGSFMMGSEKGGYDEKPVHKVTLSRFWMDKYEVTNEKYYVFVKTTASKRPAHLKEGATLKGFELNAVHSVDWADAKAYADWLGMRLPTEAEWEYACRAGTTTEYYFGDKTSELSKYAWYYKNAFDKGQNNSQEVGRKEPNGWNLYDMYGNVYEWCSDWYDSNYYKSSPTRDPKGPDSGNQRVFRGGSWCYLAKHCRSAKRGLGNPTFNRKYSGFRCVRDVK